MKVIGLTGGIATGKSTVSQYLISKGYEVIDADLVAREVVEVGQPGLVALVQSFGSSILTVDGQLDRKRLGTLIFSDVPKRQMVNELLHPYIFERIRRKREQSNQAILFIDMPLLFEVGYEKQVDEVWLVYVSKDVQLTRLMERDSLSMDLAKERLSSQWPIEQKRQLVTTIIDNSGSVKATYQQVEQALLKLKD
ncbi:MULTISPECIES: dephospho-CoA kinase [unclassified Facklamia]|uniref:dephospho-CoA kinase n=1 Tax=Aerococcaceae TaxID=186827 RepID=UPI0013B948E4|nr:dephospho-CoA kinase [Aerococcaceae bacterium zg-B36]NEW63958.1 dephospho-CoA kinase [Facklamia sp. 252]NEW67429.1 dephospho-CoA kinase [Facklamia sp. 253]QQD65303.1 dephospho-CoA kinase [Aerococcaceae bacterium zg-252]